MQSLAVVQIQCVSVSAFRLSGSTKSSGQLTRVVRPRVFPGYQIRSLKRRTHEFFEKGLPRCRLGPRWLEKVVPKCVGSWKFFLV